MNEAKQEKRRRTVTLYSRYIYFSPRHCLYSRVQIDFSSRFFSLSLSLWILFFFGKSTLALALKVVCISFLVFGFLLLLLFVTVFCVMDVLVSVALLAVGMKFVSPKKMKMIHTKNKLVECDYMHHIKSNLHSKCCALSKQSHMIFQFMLEMESERENCV